VGSLDLPDRPDQPDKPAQAMRADAGGTDGNARKSRELPDPDERGRAYDAARAHVSAETPAEASPGQRPDGGDQRSYWKEVPRFAEMWAKHERHWPTKQRAEVDRSDDPAGSYRSDGNLYLNPERHAQTTEAIRKVRRVEPTISTDMRTAERENTYGCWLDGFKNRLKGEDRLKEKVAERLEGAPDKAPGEIVREVPDAVRYTFCARSESYAKGYYDLKARLESRGYEMYESRNSWDGTEYRGINTRWLTQEGQRFEVQFHTLESYHAKEYVTHRAYERIRNPLTSDKERDELKEFQQEVCAQIQAPNGALDIPDFKKDGF
jgi:hypothetical protein